MAGAPGAEGGRGDAPPEPFVVDYQCYSVSMYPYKDCEEEDNGGKIFLPRSALEHLMRLNMESPMLFKITNLWDDRSTHCGVLQFTADEGRVYIPYWMMRNLMIDQGDEVRVESAVLPVANYAKFEPQSVEFYEISNPQAMLEYALRNFACLTAGDMIAIKYNDRTYELRVRETRPGTAVNIIECDMEADFFNSDDYLEAEAIPKEDEEEPKSALDLDKKFIAFLGEGHRLGGKDDADDGEEEED